MINYDMPGDIENYVHRIGRTGRYKRKGLATTFVNRSVDMPVLLDLRALLLEAKQTVPVFLETLEGVSELPSVTGGKLGAAYDAERKEHVNSLQKTKAAPTAAASVIASPTVRSWSRCTTRRRMRSRAEILWRAAAIIDRLSVVYSLLETI